MYELAKAVRDMGKGIGTEIIKVDCFLNHRIDTGLMMQSGRDLAAEFLSENPTLVLTVEASGIAVALAAAAALGDIPAVFAKKSPSANVTGDKYVTPVYSFTHGVTNQVFVSKEYLPAGARVLIVDDFLANGAATLGLCELCRQAGATVVGIGICVEKTWQPGRKLLEEKGYHVLSLARVTGVEDGRPVVMED